MVPAEDKGIVDISKAWSQTVFFLRSIENTNDFVSTTDVLLEVFEIYENLGIKHESNCFLHPTSVSITSELSNLEFEKLISNNVDYYSRI